jgi:hypothetical protein
MRKQLSLLAVGCCASAKSLLASTAVISKNTADVISALQAIAYLLCRISSEVYLESVRQTSKKLQEKSLLSFITTAIFECVMDSRVGPFVNTGIYN